MGRLGRVSSPYAFLSIAMALAGSGTSTDEVPEEDDDELPIGSRCLKLLSEFVQNEDSSIELVAMAALAIGIVPSFFSACAANGSSFRMPLKSRLSSSLARLAPKDSPRRRRRRGSLLEYRPKRKSISALFA